MRILNDDELLRTAVKELDLEERLDLSKVVPLLFMYDKGELFSGPHLQQRFIFFLYSGKAQIYGADREGRKVPVNLIQKGSMIGDMEFWAGQNSCLYAEALSKTILVGFSMRQYREILMDDNKFLRCLLDSISEKVYLSGFTETQETSVREKLIDYMNSCPDRTFDGIEQTTLKIRCSRRQLQRVIADLTDEGLIEKVKKGSYRLLEF